VAGAAGAGALAFEAALPLEAPRDDVFLRWRGFVLVFFPAVDFDFGVLEGEASTSPSLSSAVDNAAPTVALALALALGTDAGENLATSAMALGTSSCDENGL